jgi:hypothetical protein
LFATEVFVDGSVETTTIAEMELDLTDPENSGVLEVDLHSGNYIYSLQSNLLFETMVKNEDPFASFDDQGFPIGERLDDIAEGSFAMLGDAFNPVNVEATLAEVALAPVPVPGAAVLFFTAMTGLFGVSRRRAK